LWLLAFILIASTRNVGSKKNNYFKLLQIFAQCTHTHIHPHMEGSIGCQCRGPLTFLYHFSYFFFIVFPIAPHTFLAWRVSANNK